MAEVFLALAFGASGFEKRVVIKVLRPEHAGDAAYERMFIEEARLGARLTHRNLVGVHDLGSTTGLLRPAGLRGRRGPRQPAGARPAGHAAGALPRR